MAELTAKQQRFVDEYLVDINATRAARRSGYADGNYGRQLLTKTNVSNAIAKAKEARQKRTQVTADRVLEELALIGFSDVTNYEVDDGGHVVLQLGVSRDVTRALSSVKRKTKHYEHGGDSVTEHDVEVKLWSKIAALDSLAKHLGLHGPKGTEQDPEHHKITIEIVNSQRKADGDA